jgi:HK97 family phage major capsid protein
MKLAELLQKRAAAMKAWKDIVAKAETESRDLTADEEKRETVQKTEVADLDRKIERARDLQDAERSAPAIIENRGDGAFEERAQRDFRITRLIASSFDPSVDAGLERELGQETARRTGRRFVGHAVPDEALQPLARRTLTTNGDAAALIPATHRPDLFVDKLRPSTVLAGLGATILDGLRGVQDIPRQIGSAVADWVTEDAPLTESDGAFDDVILQPRTCGAMTSYSRRVLINASPAIEDLIRRDLAATIATAVDLSGLFGDGMSGQPLGVALQPGVHQLSMASGPTWEKILEMIALVEASNALQGSLGWALSPGAKRKLRATPKVDGDGSAGFIMDSAIELAGYRALTSTTMPGDATNSPPGPAVMLFGDWSSVLVGSWTGTDLLVNPYAEAAYARGRVMVRAMKDVDVAVRHGASFGLVVDMPFAVTG